MKIPEKIKEEYRLKRKRAEDESKHRYEIISGITDEIEKIDKEIIRLALSYGERSNTGGDGSEYIVDIADLEAKKKEILCNLGYAEDFLDTKYSCPECNDTGYTDRLYQKMCPCMKRAITKHRLLCEGIDDSQTFENFNFDIFKDPVHKKKIKALYKCAIEYVDSLPKPVIPNLIITGETGTGKTYMLNCIAHRAVERGIDVHSYTAYNMIEMYLKAIKEGKELPDFISCELLIIDDLATEPMINNITKEHILSIINEREARRLPTVIASNLNEKEILETYNERIFSRITSPAFNQIIWISGDDLRMQA